jgi:two-component system LytT family response regulator
VVDDEPRGLSALQKLLQIHCPELEIIAACDNADDAITKIKLQKPCLVFLDIAMPGKSGFDMLNSFKEIDFEIIFITAHDRYMDQAFHFSAVDYLLKPVDDDLLVEAVKRALKRIAEKQPGKLIETLLYNLQQEKSSQQMKLCISTLKGLQVIDPKDILYCEASSNYTNFYFTNGPTLCTAKSIQEYEVLLLDSGFFRIHKSYIINLLHLKEYQRGEGGVVVLSNKKVLEVSRRKKEEFLRKVKSFYKM